MPGGRKVDAFLQQRSRGFFLQCMLFCLFFPTFTAWLAQEQYLPEWAMPVLWAVAQLGVWASSSVSWLFSFVGYWMMLPEWMPPLWAVVLAYLLCVGGLALFAITVRSVLTLNTVAAAAGHLLLAAPHRCTRTA